VRVRRQLVYRQRHAFTAAHLTEVVVRQIPDPGLPSGTLLRRSDPKLNAVAANVVQSVQTARVLRDGISCPLQNAHPAARNCREQNDHPRNGSHDSGPR